MSFIQICIFSSLLRAMRTAKTILWCSLRNFFSHFSHMRMSCLWEFHRIATVKWRAFIQQRHFSVRSLSRWCYNKFWKSVHNSSKRRKLIEMGKAKPGYLPIDPDSLWPYLLKNQKKFSEKNQWVNLVRKFSEKTQYALQDNFWKPYKSFENLQYLPSNSALKTHRVCGSNDIPKVKKNHQNFSEVASDWSEINDSFI